MSFIYELQEDGRLRKESAVGGKFDEYKYHDMDAVIALALDFLEKELSEKKLNI